MKVKKKGGKKLPLNCSAMCVASDETKRSKQLIKYGDNHE